MNFQTYQELSKKTESLPAQRNAKTDIWVVEALLERIVWYSQCLQFIKKEVFYGKPIDIDKWRECFEAAQGVSDDFLIDEPPDPDKYRPLKTPVRLFHALISLVSEAGEIAELFIEILSKPEEKEELIEKLVLELGDLMWSLAILLDVIGVSLDDVLALNRQKIEARYPAGRFDKKLAQGESK
jgi:NTP pyrophosphatase (non-canonical NTP hydrolase)